MTSGRSNLWTSDIQSFLSAVLTTAAFKGILLGAIIALTWHYFILSERSRDGIRMKLFLAILMFMIILSTVLSFIKVHIAAATSRHSWESTWLKPAETTLNLVVCLMAQLFFVQRCWRIKKSSTVIVGLLVFASAIVFAGHIGVVLSEWLAYYGVVSDVRLLQGSLCFWGFSSAVLELIITTILIRFIWHSRTGIRGLDKVILSLLAGSLESSLPCLIFLASFNCAVLLKSVASVFFGYSLSSLYGISVIIALNCRWKVDQQLQQYRQEGAMPNFSALETANPITESRFFSEGGMTAHRQSEGYDPTKEFRRPSVISFVKEVVIKTPPRARLEL